MMTVVAARGIGGSGSGSARVCKPLVHFDCALQSALGSGKITFKSESRQHLGSLNSAAMEAAAAAAAVASAEKAAPIAVNDVPKLFKYFGESGSMFVALRYAATAGVRIRLRLYEKHDAAHIGGDELKRTGGGEVAAGLVRVAQVEPSAGIIVVHRDDAQINTCGSGGVAGLYTKGRSGSGHHEIM
jgi:hypothetical protein